MSPNAQKIFDEARQLSPDERDWLIESLLIENGNESEVEVTAAWDEEIKRRLDEIDSGAVETISEEEFFARMDARIKAKQKE